MLIVFLVFSLFLVVSEINIPSKSSPSQIFQLSKSVMLFNPDIKKPRLFSVLIPIMMPQSGVEKTDVKASGDEMIRGEGDEKNNKTASKQAVSKDLASELQFNQEQLDAVNKKHGTNLKLPEMSVETTKG